jgi:CubicO group peptidase (beta-lactamase class C family)
MHKYHAEIKDYKGDMIPNDTLDSYLTSRMEELNIPGLSFALINEGKVVYHKTMGYANLEENLPVTDQTIFEGASISKSVFAFFVMSYVEEGKLDLDKPLYAYLPYPDIAHDERYKKITPRMVLSHRSGFPNWRENEEDKKLKIKFEPGTDYEYSGEGYQYLAMVLKELEGTDWQGLEAVFQEKIAKPLGMEHTVFIQTPYTQSHKAEPYDGNGQWIDWKNNYWYQKGSKQFGAAYSIHSEPIDFSKWMIAVMRKELLSEASYAELFKHHTEVPDADIKLYYTLGFNNVEEPYNYVFFHGGNNDGFTCFYLLDTEKDWGYVLFTNSEYGQQLGNELMEYLDKEAG